MSQLKQQISFDSTYQRVPGFVRVKAKSSGRALGGAGSEAQLSLFLHLRDHGQPKMEITGSPGETLYALTVLWLPKDRVFLTLRRVEDGAVVAEVAGSTEAEAWQQVERQLAVRGL